jgi:phospholipase C
VNREELRANVDTIVIVVMENRSFDHVLGHLRSPQYGNRTDVVGIEDENNPRYVNANIDGQGISPFWVNDAAFQSDLPHDPEAVVKQLAYAEAMGSFAMNGFVKAFEEEFHTSVPNPPVMGLLKPSSVPTTGALAEQYTVCDNWFACLPTSTAPNRLMGMCGYTDARDTGTLLPIQSTVYEWLRDRGVGWRVYSAGLPFCALMPSLIPLLVTSHFRNLEQLAKDQATDSATDWPQVIFIEPDYYDCPFHSRPPCDNHAPLGMAPGEAFLAEVVRTLSSNADRWARTVFILTYDEHGGFFDHVPPLPVKYRNANGVSFDTTGPRVPAIVAGPFAEKKTVSHVALDNTSILQLLAERFGHGTEAYSAQVAARAQQGIGSVSEVLSADAANTAPCDVSGASADAGGDVPSATVKNSLRDGFHQAAVKLADSHQAEALQKYPEMRAYLGR